MKLMPRLFCQPFWPQHVLGIKKVTLWDSIKSKYPDINEISFRNKLKTLQLGTDSNFLKREYEMQINCENKLNEIMEKMGSKFRIIKSTEDGKDDVEWADLVISIGGDEAFLLASQMIKNNKKAIISINPKYHANEHIFSMDHSNDIENIFKKLEKGKYNLLMRNRIRTIMYGEDIHRELYQADDKIQSMKDIMKDKDCEKDPKINMKSTERKIIDVQKPRRRVLPWLALNEIYMGEYLSTGSITFTIQVDDQDVYKIQCSGICVCTGSGSSNWYRSMNLQVPETVKRLTKIAMGKEIDENEALEIIESYHRSLLFNPEDKRMSYMIRELYRAKKWPIPKSSPERGMCRKIKVISHGFDAGLVIDRGITLPFNDGTIAIFEIHPEDALKNFVLQ
ncbi:NAD kinase 2, mitochondrial-like [Vespa crabro]|uniref:NAD kinase 2, mitochondrial-like n=1 Tax=Vespa crabro TaxID=7445 RepID=UPI001F029A39|nr:NAD kinase 2, mitochondrial-like [Vespa crabro]